MTIYPWNLLRNLHFLVLAGCLLVLEGVAVDDATKALGSGVLDADLVLTARNIVVGGVFDALKLYHSHDVFAKTDGGVEGLEAGHGSGIECHVVFCIYGVR